MKITKISQKLPDYYNIETAKNPKTPPEVLAEVLKRGRDDEVSRRAANNLNTPPEVLSEVLRRGLDDGVSRFAAQNPNTPPEVLTEVLRRGRNDAVSCYAAGNPNAAPQALAEVLGRGKNDSVSRFAAKNSNTPPEILSEILRRGINDYVSQYAADNPKTPPQALAEVLRQGKDDGVSQYAASNPNTPSEALAEVLRRGLNDEVSIRAALNPNTPPQVLSEVLRRGNNDEVSICAADNPKTPTEAVKIWKILIKKPVDINKYLNNLIQSNDVTKIINILKYINLNKIDETIVENYIHTAFQNLELRNKLLTELPKEFFNKMAMTEENRKIVEEYYGKTKEVTKPSMFENVFAKEMKIIKIAQEVPIHYMPSRNTPFIYSERLTDTETESPTSGRRSNKEYIIRVYYFPELTAPPKFAIIAFNGRIGSSLTPQFKGANQSSLPALQNAGGVLYEKLNDHRKNYRMAGHNWDATNIVGTNMIAHRDDIEQVYASGAVPVGTPVTPTTPATPATPSTPTRTRRPRNVADTMREQQLQRQRQERAILEQQREEHLRQRAEETRKKEEEIRQDRNREELVRQIIWGPNINMLLDNESLMPQVLERIRTLMVNKDPHKQGQEGWEEIIENFIHAALNSSVRNNILNLSKEFFDKISMTEVDRKIVEDHFGGVSSKKEDVFAPSELENLFAKSKKWYKKASDNIMRDLAGYFKYRIVSDHNEVGFYDIWWKGFGKNLEIEKHNMPIELYKEHYNKIKLIANQQAEKSYKEATESLAEVQ